MTQKKILVTQQGYDELLKEQDHLIHVVRSEVIKELQEARAQGDLSENADYDAARDHQARVEARIRELEIMLSNVELIDETKLTKSTKTVSLGSTVRILDLSNNEEEEYTIVGSVEADPLNGKLSNVAPLAVALLDHKVGNTLEIENVEEPYEVKILEIR